MSENSEYCNELNEMVRLYQVELWSLARIGAKYGLTREGVRYRLQKVGIKMRPRARSPIPIDKKVWATIGPELVRLYVKEGIAVYKLVVTFGLPNAVIRKFLERQGIALRGPGMPLKYPKLSRLKIGESFQVPKPTSKGKWHSRFYQMATTAGIRVSISALRPTIVTITRVG